MIPGVDYIGVAVVFFCHDGAGNFLFQKRGEKSRDNHGTWDSGAGGIEFGEQPEDALWRELEEEYGCKGILEARLPPTSSLWKTDGVKKHWLALPYLIIVDRNEVKLNEPGSLTEFDWFRLNALPTPLHPGQDQYLQKYKEYFEKYIP